MNKIFNSVLRESNFLVPFAPAKKCNPAAVAAAAPYFEAGVGALGSVLGFFNNKGNNETNLQIARETNAQNKELFQKQLDYQTEMWNKANEYNDPTNQSKRLALARLRPASARALSDKAAS